MADEISTETLRFDPFRHVRDREKWLSPRLLSLIRSSDLAGRSCVDVGCGEGGLTFPASEYVGRILGIDVAEDRIARAKQILLDRGLENVSFRVADADRADYRALVREGRIDGVMANLCMSDPIIDRTSEALDAGGLLLFCCFEETQWKETGRKSRYAYSEERLREVLRRRGFGVGLVRIEREVIEFSTQEEAETYFSVGPLRTRWERDGRWERLMAYFDSGGRTFTARSQFIVRAVRL